MAWPASKLRGARETYGLPGELPIVARLLIVMFLTGIPLPLIWWLASPVSPVVVVVLAFFELVIVCGGVWRVLTGRTFSALPDRRPMSAPSLRPVDPPGIPAARSALPVEIPRGGPRQAVARRVDDGHERVLVVASEPPTTPQLRDALGRSDTNELEVLVVAPALHQSALRFWLSDADEAIRRAHEVQAATVANLDGEDVVASGDTAEGDVMQAVQDALVTFPADRIVLFVHPSSDERPHEHVDPEALAEMANVPVERHEIAA